MLIDWFTVGAQALNFAILVWLMKRFLYKPVIDAIAQREKRIAAQLADAATKEAEAHKQQEDFQQKNKTFDAQRAELLQKATDEGNAERVRLLDAARKTAEAVSAKRALALETDARQLDLAIMRRTQQEVFAITRKVLTDLAQTSLEERACLVFVGRLKGLEGAPKEDMAKALRASTIAEPALVLSAFELPSPQRAAIQSALDEIFLAKIVLRFETAPELIAGIALGANGKKLEWSISEYLGSLAASVDELLNVKVPPSVAAEPDQEAESRTPSAPASVPGTLNLAPA